jgi:hypothetical protein
MRQSKSEATVISLCPAIQAGPHHHSIVLNPFVCLSVQFWNSSGGLIERKSIALSNSLPSAFIMVIQVCDRGIM